MPNKLRFTFLTSLLLLLISCGQVTPPATTPEGAAKSAKTNALEAGSTLLQKDGPPSQLNVYLDGFHPMREDPSNQMEAHHFCRQVNEDFAQCALFDSNSKDANLNGIEYIISEKLFDQLSTAERPYWHPHNYEILSGQLVAPGLPDAAEKELMKAKMNSYGKTWHVWNTGFDKLPLGPPMLAWSFNKDGEAREDLIRERDRRLGTNTTQKRQDRQDLVPAAHPQEGVDLLRNKFSRPTQTIPGVKAKHP